MTVLDMLLLSGLLTSVLAFGVSGFAAGRIGLTLMYAVQLLILLQIDPAAVSPSSISFSVVGQQLEWQFDGLSWFFALITIGSALLVSWYASGEYGQRFQQQGGQYRLLHVGLALNVTAMLLLLASADFLSLFLGWELVSWAGVLLMILGGDESRQAGLRYITYAIAGGMAILAALVLVYSWTGSLAFDQVTMAAAQFDSGRLWTLSLLFVAGFSVKMGLLPFHLWQAKAYALTTGPAASFLGAISSRMGLFAIALVVIKVIGLEKLLQISMLAGIFSARDLLAWIAALSIVVPTYIALRQSDARLLLAWHGIGQGGYMLLGLLMMDEMGSAGGLLHVFNYATCQAALFMSVFAIIHRTGSSDLNKLGGLVTRMPLSFLVMLVGIIGLAGLPPMNGFVSKWMVYRSLLNEGMPLLFLLSVIGTLGTILSVYKLIHNSFLGQLRLEHEYVEEAPWSMTVPMLILASLIFVTGVMPGLVLEYVAMVQTALGITPVGYTLGGVVASAEGIGGDLDMIWIVAVLFAGFGLAAVLFLSTGKSRRVHQLDNYAGGHFLTAENQYQYSDNFYAGLMHQIKPWYRGSFQWFEGALISLTAIAGGLMKSFFNQSQQVIWLLVSATLMMVWILT